MGTSGSSREREEALELLRSPTASNRLIGARRLAAYAQASDIVSLRKARSGENDWWVQRALDRALDRARRVRSEESAAVDEDTGQTIARDVRAEAVEEVTTMLLHELNHLVGMIDVAAALDIDSYAGSGTAAAVERTKGFLRAVRTFRDAAAMRRDADLDLTEVVSEIVREEGYADKVQLARSDAVVARGDPALIRLVVVNALRNAMEATEVVTGRTPGDPIVNWGITDRDAWIVVLDEGAGLPEGVESLWTPGVSGKDKAVHDGFGLAIARQAADSLGGYVELRPRHPHGAACELTWEQE